MNYKICGQHLFEYCLSICIVAIILALSSCRGDEPQSPNNKPQPIPTPPQPTPSVPLEINKVFAYVPAPGQFVNKLPIYASGDTQATMCNKALEALRKSKDITLGGFGGYIVLGLTKPMQNKPGKDFVVLGNAAYTNINPNPNPPSTGGSSEPGIIYLGVDKNANGVPDPDEWYEIAGSEYRKPTTTHGYAISYTRPVPKAQYEEPEVEHIHWKDSSGQSGYISQNHYHLQCYYPLWLTESELKLEGTLLANNAVYEPHQPPTRGGMWVFYNYAWGYADDHPNNTTEAQIDIDWAVDAQGQAVTLQSIDFLRIQTGIFQANAVTGESSTEVSGLRYLH